MENVTKNLFLTGPIGSGKSTSIASALETSLAQAGGFLTVRQRDDRGQAVAFWLKRPDGKSGKIFLDRTAGQYAVHLDVFDDFGVQLLEEAEQCAFAVLDEIGGVEVLSETFMAALVRLLESDIPCIGVMKGEGPAGKLIQKLGLGDAYIQKAEQLRQWLREDENTLLYECGQFDPEGQNLTKAWVGRFCKKEMTEEMRIVQEG